MREMEVPLSGLLKELEEDIHHEEWVDFWRSYGPAIAGAVALTLVAVGGYLWWKARAQAHLEREFARYQEAIISLNIKGPNPQAREILEKLANTSQDGYALLSRLQLVRYHAMRTKGDPEAMKEAFREAEKLLESTRKRRDTGVEGAVVLGLAYLGLNVEGLSDENRKFLEEKLVSYEMPQNPWKGLALEAQGLRLLKERSSEAKASYGRFLVASEVSQSVHMRGDLEAIASGFPLPRRSAP